MSTLLVENIRHEDAASPANTYTSLDDVIWPDKPE
jgi:hypothetical protein